MFLVPTVVYNSPQMHLYGRTHYSRDYVDKSAALKVSLNETYRTGTIIPLKSST